MTQPSLAADDSATRQAALPLSGRHAAAVTELGGSVRKSALEEPHWLPTPEEIEETCRAIRNEWGHREQRRRWAGPHQQRWEVPGLNRGAAVTLREDVAVHD